MPEAEVVAAPWAAVAEEDVAGTSLFAVLPSVKAGVEDEAGADVVLEGVASAEDFPRFPNSFEVDFEASGAALVDEALAGELNREGEPEGFDVAPPKRLDAGAEGAAVEDAPPPKMFDEGAEVVAVEEAPPKMLEDAAEVAAVVGLPPNRDEADGAFVVVDGAFCPG